MSARIRIVAAIAAVAIAAAAFAGGWFASTALTSATDPRAAFARLSEADRQQMQGMSAEERQAFLKEKGIDIPSGGAGGPGGPAGMMGSAAGTDDSGRGFGRGGSRMLEGSVTGLSKDSITVALTGGGSVKALVDSSTVIATAEGSAAKLATGAKVIVVLVPEAAGVNAAKAIVVR